MITQSTLGVNGLLGNQMFQYAAMRGIAHANGFKYGLHKHSNTFQTPQGVLIKQVLYDTFQIDGPFVDTELPKLDLEDRRMPFNKQLMVRCPDNVDLIGFFQSPRYFDNIHDVIRQDFVFRPHIKQGVDINKHAIALHVRRTDYLLLQHIFSEINMDYYEQALARFEPDRPVIVFSDDTDWCAKQPLFQSSRFVISTEKDSAKDMYKMSQCSDFIIGNSTFSWWGAWLSDNTDKTVIAPAQWFNPESDISNEDLVPNDWVCI
jgi:hypothetical protein